MFTPISNYVQLGISRLLTQYQNSPLFQSLITALAQQIQLIENALVNMNILRYLNMASGVQLDNIGQIVGISRPTGYTDAQYVPLIYSQIKINTSDGQPEQIIQLYQLLTGVSQVRVFEFGLGNYILESSYYPPDQNTANSFIDIIDSAAAAGARCTGLVSYDPVVPFGYYSQVSPCAGYGVGKYASLARRRYPFGYGKNNPNIKGYGSTKDPFVGGAYQG